MGTEQESEAGRELELLVGDEDPASNLYTTAASLFAKGEFVDCSIACSDGQIQAHRIVLSAVSPYLYKILNSTPWPSPCAHPVIILRGSTMADVRLALEFIYKGRLKTSKKKFPFLMDISRDLGCVSLRKAIERSISHCGVQMFRRMSEKRSLEPEEPTIDKDEGEVSTNSVANSNVEPKEEEEKKSEQETKKLKWDEVIVKEEPGGETFEYTSEALGLVSMEDEELSEGEERSRENINIGTATGLMGDIRDESGADETPASCPWCLQVFTNLSLLQRHIKTHVGSYKPFTCEYCHNTFARSAHLKRHLRTHTGEKPYQCTICLRPFARQDKLKVHLERHLHNSVKEDNRLEENRLDGVEEPNSIHPTMINANSIHNSFNLNQIYGGQQRLNLNNVNNLNMKPNNAM